MTNVHNELAAMEALDEDFALNPGRKTEERYKLVQAIRNLLDGCPTNDALKSMMEEDGWVPITKDTVEIEAGVNRRRFSGRKSENPDLSEMLKRLKPDHGISKTTTERLAKQGERIRLLEQQLTASRSAAAAQILRIEALNMKLKLANARICRLREQGITRE